MLEYWVVYHVATAAILWRGSGPEGTAEHQALPEGAAILVLSYPAFVALPDLALLKVQAQQQVDSQAGAFRSRYITSVPGQAETYLYKANEARAWTADNAAPTPMMTPEAAARGMTVAALAAEVLAAEAAWLAMGGRVEAVRVSAKAAIGAAGTIPAVVAAARIDWAEVAP